MGNSEARLRGKPRSKRISHLFGGIQTIDNGKDTLYKGGINPTKDKLILLELRNSRLDLEIVSVTIFEGAHGLEPSTMPNLLMCFLRFNLKSLH